MEQISDKEWSQLYSMTTNHFLSRPIRSSFPLSSNGGSEKSRHCRVALVEDFQGETVTSDLNFCVMTSQKILSCPQFRPSIANAVLISIPSQSRSRRRRPSRHRF
jgi:hypothetical protein